MYECQHGEKEKNERNEVQLRSNNGSINFCPYLPNYHDRLVADVTRLINCRLVMFLLIAVSSVFLVMFLLFKLSFVLCLCEQRANNIYMSASTFDELSLTSIYYLSTNYL